LGVRGSREKKADGSLGFECILRYSPAGERMERTTKTQRTQRLIATIENMAIIGAMRYNRRQIDK
jgi:hypothetical protein